MGYIHQSTSSKQTPLALDCLSSLGGLEDSIQVTRYTPYKYDILMQFYNRNDGFYTLNPLYAP